MYIRKLSRKCSLRRFLLLLPKEEIHNLTTPFTPHHPACPLLLKHFRPTLRHSLVLINILRWLILLIFNMSYTQFFSKKTRFIIGSMQFIILPRNIGFNYWCSIIVFFNTPPEITRVHKQTLRNNSAHLNGLNLILALCKESKALAVRRNLTIYLKVNRWVANFKLSLLNDYMPTANPRELNTVIPINGHNFINNYNVC